MSKMKLNAVASTIVVFFLTITLFDGTQSRKITGDDIQTVDNPAEGPKCLRHGSLECGPTAFCWNGFCRDTIFERTCELYKCRTTDDGWTWWDLASQSQNSKPGFECDRDVNTECSYEACTVDKDCHPTYSPYKYCDLGICVKGERPLVRDSQR